MKLMDVNLCKQTVTLYRHTGGMVTRNVVLGCYLKRTCRCPGTVYGEGQEKTFLLILPAEAVSVQPGDRVWDGIGPEVEHWQNFLPAAYPELMEVSFATPRYWEGEISHWEAGHR